MRCSIVIPNKRCMTTLFIAYSQKKIGDNAEAAVAEKLRTFFVENGYVDLTEDEDTGRATFKPGPGVVYPATLEFPSVQFNYLRTAFDEAVKAKQFNSMDGPQVRALGEAFDTFKKIEEEPKKTE